MSVRYATHSSLFVHTVKSSNSYNMRSEDEDDRFYNNMSRRERWNIYVGFKIIT